MNWKDRIFSLFGAYDKAKDVNKDVDGKGTYERYNEVVGKDIDDNLRDFIDNMVEWNVQPSDILTRFFPYRLTWHGVKSVLFYNTESWTRKQIRLFNSWSKIRGTLRLYYILFGMMGLECEIIETYMSGYFDSPDTFDHPLRTFDMKCYGCGFYRIVLTGAGPLPEEKVRMIARIVEYNNPINATFTGYTYIDTDMTDFDGADFDGGDFY